MLWKTVWQLLKRLKREEPYDPATPLVGLYPKELKAEPWRDICTSTLIPALFTIVKAWKQAKCSSPAEWISKTCYMMECYSALERKAIGWAPCLMPVIPALWEAETGGSQGQEFKTSLPKMAKPSLLKIQKLARHVGGHLLAQLIRRLRWEDCSSPGGQDCSE